MNARVTRISLALSFCAAVCSAQVAAKPAAEPAAAQPPGQHATLPLTPAARSNRLARSGGMLQAPLSGPAILLLNTQKRVPAAALQDISTQIQKFVQLPCLFDSISAKEPIADATKALANTNHAAVIVICDSPGQPALLVAPESRWALVNVAALGGADVPADKITERVQKEIWRAFGYVMGAANSNFEHCVLKPVLSIADLDALAGKTISPEPFVKIWSQAQKLGVKNVRVTSYRKAVEEGWAPAPTNEIQRAIWQELKKTPAK